MSEILRKNQTDIALGAVHRKGNSDGSFDNFLQFMVGKADLMVVDKANTTTEPTKQQQKIQPLSNTLRSESSIFAIRDGHSLEYDNILFATVGTKKKPSKTILNGTTSSFEPKTLTAVMGPR